MPPLLQQANIDHTEDNSSFKKNFTTILQCERIPTTVYPHNHPVNFTLFCFNAYCIKYHIWILILVFYITYHTYFNQFLQYEIS